MIHAWDTAEVVVPLTLMVPSPEASALLPESSARRLAVVPMAVICTDNNRTLVVACSNPSDPTLSERLQRSLPRSVDIQLWRAEPADIQFAMDKCFSRLALFQTLADHCRIERDALLALGDKGHFLSDLIEAMLREACRSNASDIHISPAHNGVLFRIRVDGVLRAIACISHVVLPRFLVRLKVMSSLDIAETRQPQDGQFALLIDAQLVEFRVSTFPTILGENTVIRVLDNQAKLSSLAEFDLPEVQYEQLTEVVHRPNGLILLCGPTGSGKSTTLYAMLAHRDSASLNVMTLEDPVERSLAGIRQSNIDADRSLDYAQGVRALLRQDPDVLLIGEVRDSLSCKMTMRAVMTGHQVFTTVHANDVSGALDRLVDLGASCEVLANHLVAIASQRLLRKRCIYCSWQHQIPECIHCHGSGYKGRQIIMEILLVTPDIQARISQNGVSGNLNCGEVPGFETLRERAMALVQTGVTDENEVIRVLGPEFALTPAKTERKVGN